ncbi:MAG: AbrB/MazE/SpoVT family DNA-binding domain-containing protein [Tepidisphaeraceae bacterium]
MEPALRSTLRVADGGRIVIPAAVRQHLGMEVGTEVVLTVEDGHAILMNAKSARSKARERVRRYVPPDLSLSKELMAERKADARRE